MIRAIVRLGHWLDTRFPEKVVVKTSDYQALQARIDVLEALIASVQATAVHKSAVQDLIAVVKAQKDDIQSFKTSLGFNRTEAASAEALLNGEYLGATNERI